MYICNLIIEFIATNKLNIDKLKSEFIDKPIFTTKDIQTFYLTIDPNIKLTTINWRVYKLAQSGIISRVGREKFKFGMSKIYIPEVSSKMKSIYKKLKKELIKEKLKSVGLNQNDLAKILGHKKGYMSELINGLRPFSKEDIIVINRLFKIKLEHQNNF